MTRPQIIAAAAAFATLSGFASLPARAEATSLKPLAAATFKIGGETAVSYFTTGGGRCHLVVTRAGAPAFDASGSFAAHRFETAIPALKTATYMGSVTFKCAADARSMSISKGADVAAN